MRVVIRRLARPTCTYYPISDVHWPKHDTKMLDTWLEAVKADPTAVVTLGGDLFDFARGTYRQHAESFTADDNSQDPIDEMAHLWVEQFAAYLRPIAKKVVGCVVGNHFWRFKTGRVSDQELALKLGCGDAFCGAFGLIRLDIPKGGQHTSITLALHHDAGRRGGTEGADLNAFIHWSRACRANVYAAGHTHEQWVRPGRAQILIHHDDRKLGDAKLVFVRSGAFAKSYGATVDNPEAPYAADYPEAKMLPPAGFGIVSVGISLNAQGRPQYDLRHRML